METERSLCEQLVYLVRQAHENSAFQTQWNIQVSDEMRVALQAPLSSQQVYELSQAKDDIDMRSIGVYLLSYNIKRGLMSGVVNVSIDIHSKSGLHNYHFEDVKLYLAVESDEMTEEWKLVTVQQQA